jgi:hypothetical protein
MTRDLSYINNHNNKIFQFCEFTTLAGNSRVEVKCDLTSSSVSIVSGKTYGIEVFLYLESLTATTLDGTIQARLDFTKSGTKRFVLDTFQSPCVINNNKLEGKIKFPRITINSDSADLSSAAISISFATGSVGEKIKLGVAAVRVVEQ